MKIYSALEKAQLESITTGSEPAAATVGRIWWNSTTSLVRVDTGTVLKTLVDTDSTQTLTGKTLTGNTAVNLVSGSGTLTLNTSGTVTLPNATDTLVGKATTDTLTNKTMGDALTFTQISTPSTPSSGFTKVYSKSDGKLYKLPPSGIEAEVGSGGSGLKNYLGTVNGVNTNGDFETGATTGFNKLTVSLSSLVPTGSPTVGSAASITTFAVNSSSPLGGTYDLQVGASSGFTAGQGIISDAVTLDVQDRTSLLGFSFSYILDTAGTGYNMSGTSANTFHIYVWDATNSAWLQPAGVYSMAAYGGVGFASGTFQPDSTTASIRFAVIVANATSSNTVIRFNDFFVGPQVKVEAPAVSKTMDLTSNFTPTGFGTVTNKSIWGWRVGDRLVVQGHFTAGTATGVTATLDFSGYTIDSAKMHSSSIGQPVGDLERVGAAISDLVIFYDGSTTNKLYFNDNASSGGSILGRNGTQVSNNNDSFNFNFSVPIAGWDTNVATSAEQSGRVIAALWTTSSTSVASASTTDVVFTTKVVDTTNSFDGTTYICPESGSYCVQLQLETSGSTGTTGGYTAQLFKNGSLHSLYEIPHSLANFGYDLPISRVVSLVAGDTLKVRYNQNTGHTEALDGSATGNYFSIFKIQGPVTVQASETVAARYKLATGTLNSSDNVIKYTTKQFDTHGAYSTSTGLFTVPISGKYYIGGGLGADFSNMISGGDFSISVYKTGSEYSRNINRTYNTGAAQGYIRAFDIVDCVAGDTIALYSSTGHTVGGGIVGNATREFIDIYRVGN